MSQRPIIPEDLAANAVFGNLHNWIANTASRGTKLGLSRVPVSLIPNLVLKENPILGIHKMELPASRCRCIPNRRRVSLRLWFTEQEDYTGDAFREMLSGFSLTSHRVIFMCSGNNRGIQHRILLHANDEFGIRNLVGGAFKDLHIECEEPGDFQTRVVQQMAGKLYFRHLLPSAPFWGTLSGQGLHLPTINSTLMRLDDKSYGIFQWVLSSLPPMWRQAIRLMGKAETIVASRYPKQDPWSFSRDAERTTEDKLNGVLYAASMRFGLFSSSDDINAHQIMTSMCMSTGGMLFNGAALRFATETDCLRSHIRPPRIRDAILSGRVYQSGILVSHHELAGGIKFPSSEDLSNKSLPLDRKPPLAANLGVESGIVLAHQILFDKETAVIWPHKLRTTHMIISGATGAGKTEFLAGLAANIAEHDHEGEALIDPHDKAIERLAQCAPESRLADMILDDPMDDEYVLCLPLFDCQSPDQIDAATSNITHQIFALSSRAETSTNINPLIHNLVRTIITATDMSFLEGLKLLDLTSRGEGFREQVCAGLSDETLLEYWQEEFPLVDKESVGRARNRILRLVESRRMRPILANRIRKISYREIIDAGKIFLSRTSPAEAGVDLASTLGTLRLTGFQTAACSRPGCEGSRPVFTIIADEFGNYSNPRAVSHALRTLRKYDVSEILVTQNVESLPAEVKVAIGNINTHVVFKQGWDDAHHYFKAFCGTVPVSEFWTKDTGEGYAKIGTRLAAISCRMPEVLRDVRVLEDIRDMTRKKYCVPMKELRERMIEDKGVSLEDMKNLDLL